MSISPPRRSRLPQQATAGSGRYGPIPGWPRLIREMHRRWGIYRRCRADLRRLAYSEPAVHDYRVSAQRLMAALRLAERLIPNSPPKRLRKLVRKRFHGVRRLRDVQVMLLNLPKPRPQAKFLLRLRRLLLDEEREIRQHLLRHSGNKLARDEAAHVRSVLRALISRARGSSDAALTRVLRSALGSSQTRVQTQIHALEPDNLSTLHAVRIALKRARYELELVAVSHKLASAKAAYRTAQGWQDLLGGIRDLQVMTEELAVLQPRGPADVTALRVFRARLHRHETEGVRTLLRQRAQLQRFGNSIQCLPAPSKTQADPAA